MKSGIYYDVPMNEYKKWPGVHKSMFKSILKSGLHFKYFLDHGEEETGIMHFGNLVDTLLLEPGLFLNRYMTIPETYESDKGPKPWNWNANACKGWREQILNDTPDIEIIKTDDLDRARKIVDAIKNHAEAGEWLSGKKQVSLYWTDPETGIDCKGRVDVLREDRIVDLKVTDDPHPRSFSGIVNRFLYHAGGAFYHDGYLLAQGKSLGPGPNIPFSFIAAEAEEPHDVVTYDLGPESFDCGRIVYREALARYKEMQETGEYNGYSQVTEEIEIPQWARNRLQLEGVIE
jgi:exodeoxyribonuclease VIII